MILYISGPMTGIPEMNIPAFEEATKRLREWGYKVLSPHHAFGGQAKLRRVDYMREDLGMVMRAEGIVLLDGWADSVGARLEVAIGQELALPFYVLADLNGGIRGVKPALIQTIVS